MRLHFVLLVHVLLFSFVAFSDATFAAKEETHHSKPTAPFELRSLTGRGGGLRKRFLRMQATKDAESAKSVNAAGYLLPIYEEERIGAMGAAGMLTKALKMKTKMKVWLLRGVDPAVVLNKLRVASKEDENYKYYSKYFFKYVVKYPKTIPSNIPASLLDDIMKARMHDWIYTKQFSPPQVFKELGMTGSFASAEGHPYYKYFKEYHNMWTKEQNRLSPTKPELKIVLES